jgi:hypothetical protein
LDTARLLGAWAGKARASAINSGAPFAMKTSSRGEDTFLPLAAFPRPDGTRVVEVVVPGAIPDAPPALLQARPIAQTQGS